MNDLGRRYFLFSGTPGGKQRIAQVCLLVALIVQVVFMLLDSRAHFDNRVVHGLAGFFSGIVLVAAVFMFMNAKAR